MLLIDGIQNVTMANGLVRIQVVQTGADGKSKGVEEIAIPSNQFANVVQGLQKAGQNLQQKMQDQQKQPEGQQQEAPKQAADPAQADNFDFS